MSQYVEFYLQDKEEKLHYINAYCQGSGIYHFAQDYVDYGKGAPLTADTCRRIQSDIFKSIQNHKKEIERIECMKNDICKMENTVEEKINALQQLDTEIAEEIDTIDDYKYADTFFDIMYDMVFFNDVTVYFGLEWRDKNDNDC